MLLQSRQASRICILHPHLLCSGRQGVLVISMVMKELYRQSNSILIEAVRLGDA